MKQKIFVIIVLSILLGAYIVYKPHLYLTDRYMWHINLAYKYDDISRHDKILEHLNKAIAIDPDREFAHRFKFKLYLMTSELNLAEYYLNSMKRNDFYLINKGFLEIKKNQPIEAINSLNNFDNEEYISEKYLGLGIAYYLLSEDEKSIQFLYMSIDNKPNDFIKSLAHAFLGSVYKAQGYDEKYLIEYREADKLQYGINRHINQLKLKRIKSPNLSTIS